LVSEDTKSSVCASSVRFVSFFSAGWSVLSEKYLDIFQKVHSSPAYFHARNYGD
jgi:hypothetical protein